jgi:hypothetical protein
MSELRFDNECVPVLPSCVGMQCGAAVCGAEAQKLAHWRACLLTPSLLPHLASCVSGVLL